MKLTFNVAIDVEKLINYKSALRLDKESAQAMIDDLAKSSPKELCKALSDKAHIILMEGEKQTVYLKIVQNLTDIARSDSYRYKTVERIFRKEDDHVNYVDIIHVGEDFEAPEDSPECRVLHDIMVALDYNKPKNLIFGKRQCNSQFSDVIYSCGNITVQIWDDRAIITGLTKSEEDELERFFYGNEL